MEMKTRWLSVRQTEDIQEFNNAVTISIDKDGKTSKDWDSKDIETLRKKFVEEAIELITELKRDNKHTSIVSCVEVAKTTMMMYSNLCREVDDE